MTTLDGEKVPTIKCLGCLRGIRGEAVLSGERFWHQRCLDKENWRAERQAAREAADPMCQE